MEKLIEKLKEFERNTSNLSSEEELQKSFDNLAPVFLCGGYIQVRQDYKVYIRTVEFYFHSEMDNGIHDPIVYHRNGRDLEKVPYFSPMSLHAHNSGFDITFEKKDEYRASALIRSYEVKSNDEKFYIVWNKKTKMFEESREYGYNTQSTYLYILLNGFSLGNENDIKWIDSPRESQIIPGKPRQNVFRSECDTKYKPIKGKKCERNWSFTRVEHL